MEIELRKCDENDYDFAFEAKRQAMGPHIKYKWGWDEAFQLSVHNQRWNEKPWFIIIKDGIEIGTVSIHEQKDAVRFGEFYLLKEHQRKGIGTIVISEFIESCDKNNRKIILEYLKWSPVGSLYKRHGFRTISENEIHYFMERKPNQH